MSSGVRSLDECSSRVRLAASSPVTRSGGRRHLMGDMATDRDGDIYRQHAQELCRLATVLVGSSNAADVVSEAVVAALSSRSWPSVADRRAYLFQAVVNAARARARSDGRRTAREQRWMHAQPLVHAFSTGILVDGSDDVLRAVMGLSPRQRAVVYLVYWEDMTPASSGALLGISEGSVRRHLARARRHLREVLDED